MDDTATAIVLFIFLTLLILVILVILLMPSEGASSTRPHTDDEAPSDGCPDPFSGPRCNIYRIPSIVPPPPDFGELDEEGWSDENKAVDCMSANNCNVELDCDVDDDECYCMQHCGNTKQYYNCGRRARRRGYGPQPCWT